MNSSSHSRAAIASGAKTTSKSTEPPPSLPGNADIFPSNLLAAPLLTATGFPHPKSLSYIGNRGELPICTVAPSWFPKAKHCGSHSQSSMARFTASLSYALTLLFSCFALHERSLHTTSSAVAHVAKL
ncbi:hypothetical protein Ahy_A10g049708 [Arachis hypogaea]|uniref:Uncharacterized protein n=1 Tax=Arachis hypogaea TaxID=3818 RepID=A0A444X2I5_ARAHY|nr:hypothetical protein Ahy_B10g102767 [Arachis hypogaea]RYR34711.1 hypothetical protein Ahy_A10g049708 [Arachis hypogaea]